MYNTTKMNYNTIKIFYTESLTNNMHTSNTSKGVYIH